MIDIIELIKKGLRFKLSPFENDKMKAKNGKFK